MPGMRRREFVLARRRGGRVAAAARAQTERIRRVGVLLALVARMMRRRQHARPRWSKGCNGRAGSKAAICGSTTAFLRPIRRPREDTRPNSSLWRPTSSLQRHSVHGTPAAGNSHGAYCVCQCRRPSGRWLCRQSGSTGRKRYRIFAVRIQPQRKWVELLKEIAPRVTRVAVLRDPTVTSGIGQFAVVQSVAPSAGMEVVPINVRDPAEIERRFGLSRTLRMAG